MRAEPPWLDGLAVLGNCLMAQGVGFALACCYITASHGRQL